MRFETIKEAHLGGDVGGEVHPGDDVVQKRGDPPERPGHGARLLDERRGGDDPSEAADRRGRGEAGLAGAEAEDESASLRKATDGSDQLLSCVGGTSEHEVGSAPWSDRRGRAVDSVPPSVPPF